MSISPPSSYSRYIALFIDVMGQQDILAKTPDPLDPNCLERSDTQELFNDSVERIHSVSDNLKGFFECHSVVNAPGFKIETQFFSDSMLFYFPLEIIDDVSCKERQLYGIVSLFAAAAFSQISFLAVGTPLRGGIDVGLGALTPHAGLYGPINHCVAHLEKKASYPRIAIGDNLIRYIKSEERKYPELCTNLMNMCTNRDGVWMIDFTCRLIVEAIFETKSKIDSFTPDELVRKVVLFVLSKRDEYKILADNETKTTELQCGGKYRRVYEKYCKLYDYLRG